MKILYYSGHPHLSLASPSGYGTHMRETIKAFGELGHEVLPLIIGGHMLPNSEESSHIQTNPFKEVIRKFIPTYLWETLKDFQLKKIEAQSYQKLMNEVSNFKPDLLYERGAYLTQSGMNAAQENNIPYFVEFNAPFVEERIAFAGRSWFNNEANSIEKEQLVNCDKLIVVSSALKTYYNEKSDVSNKTIITPNAINLDTAASANSNFKIEGITVNDLVIGFVGSIFPYHGVQDIITIFPSLKARYSNVKLLIVGGGEILTKLQQQVNNIGANLDIIFTGSVPHTEVFNYINLMDITVMPNSNWYGSPVKIFEYAYMNKAVVALNNGPMNDVMKHEKDGILIESNLDSLEDALNKLLGNEPLRTAYAQHFHDKVVEHHTWFKMGKKILKDFTHQSK